MTKQMAHAPIDIANLTVLIVQHLESLDADIGTKMAACRTAAMAFEQSISAQSIAVMMNNILNGTQK